MGNLGINCDLKSCHLCDNCIFDDDYAEIIMEEKNVKRQYCDDCPCNSKLKVNTGTTAYFNLYCNKDDTRKLIDISVPQTKKTSAPCWCPHNKAIDNAIVFGSTTIEKKGWNTIQPQISFDDIKEGDIYHVPPYENHKRMDILITRKTDYSASYKELSENARGFNINTIYPNTNIMRMLTKHKILDIKVENIK